MEGDSLWETHLLPCRTGRILPGACLCWDRFTLCSFTPFPFSLVGMSWALRSFQPNPFCCSMILRLELWSWRYQSLVGNSSTFGFPFALLSLRCFGGGASDASAEARQPCRTLCLPLPALPPSHSSAFVFNIRFCRITNHHKKPCRCTLGFLGLASCNV